jgi:hypothetical protein
MTKPKTSALAARVVAGQQAHIMPLDIASALLVHLMPELDGEPGVG